MVLVQFVFKAINDGRQNFPLMLNPGEYSVSVAHIESYDKHTNDHTIMRLRSDCFNTGFVVNPSGVYSSSIVFGSRPTFSVGMEAMQLDVTLKGQMIDLELSTDAAIADFEFCIITMNFTAKGV